MLPPFTMRTPDEVAGSILIGSILLLIAYLVIWTVRYELRVRQWISEGPEHQFFSKGKVIRILDTNENTEKTVQYSFTDLSGRERKGAQVFSRLTQPELIYPPGAPIDIVYNSEHPSLNYIKGNLATYRLRETSYIMSFAQLVVFMTVFRYTSSFIWPFVSLFALPILKLIARKIFNRPKTNL